MKLKLRVVTLAILITLGFVIMPPGGHKQAAFTAEAAATACSVRLVNECAAADGVFFYGCCKCSLLPDVQACADTGGTWDHCTATCNY
jgi:hypothetical protein